MNKKIKCIPIPNIKNAYIVISAHKTNSCNGVKKCMSFFYGGKDIGAEWEPDYGPITVIYNCSKDNKQAQEHFFYDYCDGYGAWSQCAVRDEHLDRMFIEGDYDGIFRVLKQWATK